MNPIAKLLIVVVLSFFGVEYIAGIRSPQEVNPLLHHCLTNELFLQLEKENSNYLKQLQQFDNQILRFIENEKKSNSNLPYIIPVVVHVIHQNGSENLSEVIIQQAIERLNNLFANVAPYQNNTGIATQISFCLAQRTPDNQATNGINKIVSPLTNLIAEEQDTDLKNLTQWAPQQYLNLYLVNSITSTSIGDNIIGYAYLPSFHGSDKDGVVIEASVMIYDAGAAVLAHEMGHYLGLYHTFEGGCNNGDCAINGDRVCDTPPDNTTVATACDVAVNSCFTDTESGFVTDENDLGNNYMDYIRLECYEAFTQGQAERMQATLETRRRSLLASPVCQPPCLNPVVANLIYNAEQVVVNQLVSFENDSQNGTDYIWKVNGEIVANTTDLDYAFTETGTYSVRLIVVGNTTCAADSTAIELVVNCPLQAQISISATALEVGETMILQDISTGVESREWRINNEVVSTAEIWEYTRTSAEPIQIDLIAKVGDCVDVARLNEIFYTEFDCSDNFVSRHEILVYKNDEPAFAANTISTHPTAFFITTHQADKVALEHAEHGRRYENAIHNNQVFYPFNSNVFDFTDNRLCGEICDNGIDDDGDGLIDCFDDDCCGDVSCEGFYFPTCEVPHCRFETDQPFQISRLEVIHQLPAAAPHTMPVIGDMNGDGIIEIVAKQAPLKGVGTDEVLTEDLVIYNINQDETSFIEIETPEIQLLSTPAIADVDRDSEAEIYFLAADSPRNSTYHDAASSNTRDVRRRLFCFEKIGGTYLEKWVSSRAVNGIRPYSVSIADLNMDGLAELIIGDDVYNAHSGDFFAKVPGGFLPTAETLIAVDALPDNYCPDCTGLELIGNGRAYTVFIDANTPSNSYIKTELKSGLVIQNHCAVADIDQDGDIDAFFTIIEPITNAMRLAFWDIQDPDDIRNSILAAGETGRLSVTIGDVTPDPGLEIAVESEFEFYLLNSQNFQPIWRKPLQPTGYFVDYASMFDFDGNGYQEIIFGGRQGIEIINEQGEGLVFRQAEKKADGEQIPIVADINNDGITEILYADNDGLAVLNFELTDTNNNIPWNVSRSVWNQKYFFNVHINDNLTIPIELQQTQQLDEHASSLNGFLMNYAHPYFPTVELSLELLDLDCTKLVEVFQGNHQLDVKAEICNQGTLPLQSPVNYSISTRLIETRAVDEPPSVFNAYTPTQSQILDENNNIIKLQPNECQQVILRTNYFLSSSERGYDQFIDSIYVAINIDRNYLDDFDFDFYPSHLAECDYSNNLSIWLTQMAAWHEPSQFITICDNETKVLTAPSGFETYQWHDGSIDSAFTAQGIGKYWVDMTDKCGKIVTDTFYLRTLGIERLLLPDTIFICRGAPVVIDIPNFSNARWFPQTDLGDCENCVDFQFIPTESRTYEVVANTETGCHSIDTVHIQIIEPQQQILDTFVCTNATFLYDNVEIPADDFHRFTYIDQYGCDSILVVNVEGLDAAAYYIERDTAICENAVLEISNQTYSPDTTVILNYETIDGCDSIITLTINRLQTYQTNEERTICAGDSSLIFDTFEFTEGVFSQHHIAANGCDSIHEINLIVLPELVAAIEITPTCFNENTGAIKIETSGGLPPYQYQWSHDLPNISNPNNLAKDDYQLTLTDDFGCQLLFDFSIENSEEADLIFTAIPTSCFDANDGQLIVENATPDFRFQLNEGNVLTFDQLINLEPANYQLTIFDENNCAYQYEFSISEPDALELTLPADTMLRLGDSLILKTQFNREQSFEYQWIPSDGLSCDNCPEPMASPTQNTLYELTISNASGCSISQNVFIRVDETERIYLPTAFSPNDDGINDVYEVFGGSDIAKILSIRIFDRWGGEVFNSEDKGALNWDGKRHQQFVNNGVYVVQVVAERVNGERLVTGGNVTVFR